MQAGFPTISVFKEAALRPLGYVGDIAVSLGMLIGGLIVAGLVMALIMIAGGVSPDLLEAIAQSMETGQAEPSGALGGIGWALLGFLFAVLSVAFFAAHIFNFWVNLAAHGRDDAHWSFTDGRFASAAVNMLKFVFIGILIGVINLVLVLILSALGLGPSLAEQAAATGGYTDSVLSGLTTTIISVIVASAVYSLFSANLTQTALHSGKEGLEHPHIVDFAIVLVLLYAIYLVPTVLFALAGLEVMTLIVSLLFGLYMLFTIPFAHGLRYRICVAEKTPDELE